VDETAGEAEPVQEESLEGVVVAEDAPVENLEE